jgi:hypothetical protein
MGMTVTLVARHLKRSEVSGLALSARASENAKGRESSGVTDVLGTSHW